MQRHKKSDRLFHDSLQVGVATRYAARISRSTALACNTLEEAFTLTGGGKKNGELCRRDPGGSEKFRQEAPQGFQGTAHLGLDRLDGNALNLGDLGVGQVTEAVHREDHSGLLG